MRVIVGLIGFIGLFGHLTSRAEFHWSGSLKSVYEDCLVEDFEHHPEGAEDLFVVVERSPRVCLWEKRKPTPAGVLGFYGNPLRINFVGTDSRVSNWIEQVVDRYQRVLAIADEVCDQIRGRNLQGKSLSSREFQQLLNRRFRDMRNLTCAFSLVPQDSDPDWCTPLWLFLINSPRACKANPVRSAFSN